MGGEGDGIYFISCFRPENSYESIYIHFLSQLASGDNGQDEKFGDHILKFG